MDDWDHTERPRDRTDHAPDAGARAPDSGEGAPAPTPPRRRRVRIDWSIMFFVLLAIAAGAANWWYGGEEAVRSGAEDATWALIDVLPQLLLGILVAAFTQVVIPRDSIARVLGERSGFKGLLLATTVGTVMPGGPFASFPLVYAFAHAGADIGSLIAFLVAWATLSLNRLLIWEIPFMGVEFGTLRFLASLPLPILAGLFARWLAHSFPRFRDPLRGR